MDKLLMSSLSDLNYKVFAYFAPENEKFPYAVYNVISKLRDNHSTGQGNLKEVRYQISVYSENKKMAESMAQNIEDNMLIYEEFSVFVYQSFTEIEDDTKVFRCILDFKLSKN